MSPLKRFLLVRREGAITVEYWCVVTMRKILYFLGGSVHEGGSAMHPANAIVRAGRVGRGLTKGGGVLLGRTTAYYLVEGTQGVNCIIAAGEKWLCRSIFVGKTNLGCGFWPRSGKHDPRQRATTSLKLGVGNKNVAKY